MHVCPASLCAGISGTPYVSSSNGLKMATESHWRTFSGDARYWHVCFVVRIQRERERDLIALPMPCLVTHEFLRAFRGIQELHVGDSNSFWVIAGYHGIPLAPFDPDQSSLAPPFAW